MHQFSIVLDDDTDKGLRAMARVARRHPREQAAVLVDRAIQEWQRNGSLASAAMLDAAEQPAAVGA